MRHAHKIGVLLFAIALLIVLLLLPRHGTGAQQEFGRMVVRGNGEAILPKPHNFRAGAVLWFRANVSSVVVATKTAAILPAEQELVGARARFMELAARRLANRKLVYSALPSQAYLVGILSLAHVALQMTKESLEHELGLSPAIWRAIHSHQGDLGALLQCAEAVETQNEDEIARCARRWPILGNEEIARLAIEAAIWAQRQTECGR